MTFVGEETAWVMARQGSAESQCTSPSNRYTDYHDIGLTGGGRPGLSSHPDGENQLRIGIHRGRYDAVYRSWDRLGEGRRGRHAQGSADRLESRVRGTRLAAGFPGQRDVSDFQVQHRHDPIYHSTLNLEVRLSTDARPESGGLDDISPPMD